MTRVQKRMIKVQTEPKKKMHFKASLFPSLLIMPKSLFIMGFGLFGCGERQVISYLDINNT